MDLTKLQLSELMCKHASKGNSLHDLMEIMLESMMVAERGEILAIVLPNFRPAERGFKTKISRQCEPDSSLG